MLEKNDITVVAFDYGNTLIEFTQPQLAAQSVRLRTVLMDLYRDFEQEHLDEIRHAQILAPYARDFVENDIHEVSAELVRKLFNEEPPDEHIQQIIHTRRQAFEDTVFLPEDVKPLLEALAARYRLAFISNYPCGISIRNTLSSSGIEHLFESTIISGEVGRIKPHPMIYDAMLDDMGVSAEEVVYIGDNWLADVQGAKRRGLKSIWTRQFVPYENFEEQEGDHQPDAVIEHIEELRDLLL